MIVTRTQGHLGGSVNILKYQKNIILIDEAKTTTIHMNLSINNHIHIYKQPNANHSILTSIKLKNTSLELFLTINANLRNTYVINSIKSQPSINKKYVSILKSCLQKAIRRKLVIKSLNIAHELININHTFELLKRLCIIILEDCVLVKCYPLLVYLMILSSKKNLTSCANNIILNIIKHMCDINFVHTLTYEVDKTLTLDTLFSRKSTNKNSVLMSLLIRKTYGGMQSDVIMIDKYVNEWDKHYKLLPNVIKSEFNRVLVITHDYENLCFDKDKHLIKQGIDFHCSPSIINILNYQFNIPKEDLTSAIWCCRSSVNKRTILNIEAYVEYINQQIEYKKIYDTIKDKLDILSKNIISQDYEK